MNKDHVKFLNFRNELLKLLNKYNYDLQGTQFDDGSMYVDNFILTGNYDAVWINDEDKWVYLMDEYILGMFSENTRFPPLNNNTIGIFSNNPSKADKILSELASNNKDNVKFHRKSKDFQELILNDETRYIWIKISNNSRGYKVSQAYIDREITLDELYDIIVPVCFYCTRDKIKII